MGAAIGNVLGLAAGVAVRPLPIVAIILMLVTAEGRANGTLFAAGWLAGLAVLGTVVLLLASPAGASEGGEPGRLDRLARAPARGGPPAAVGRQPQERGA